MHERVVLIREERFFRTPDGQLWSLWGTGQHTWAPFLTAFKKISLVARIKETSVVPEGATLASYDNVQVCPVTYFHGPWQYLKYRPAIQEDLDRWLATPDPLVFRIPSPLANGSYSALTRRRRPFAVEVAADPYDQMSPGAMHHPLRPFFRWRYTHLQRKLTSSARVVRYVTRSALQCRYPAAGRAAVHAVSDVFLPPDAFRSRQGRTNADPLRLVFVGMLEQLYKGPDLLLRAIAGAKQMGTFLSLRVVGDGHYRPTLQKLADRLGINEAIEFLGVCDRHEIQRVLDASDLFVLPSRQEGLPRAMLEAMARSLPCVGTDVGGIPELLERDFLVPPNRWVELTAKLVELASDSARLAAAGERNLAVARSYELPVRFERESAFAHDVSRFCR
jgi:phosphatidylinositol alpha-1,6-mannosyltransferase